MLTRDELADLREEHVVTGTSRRRSWLVRLAVALGLVIVAGAAAVLWISRADGPVFVFAGGPLRSGEPVELAEIDWPAVDTLHELEMEIVAAESSRTLWFSVLDGVPYVACDLDCIDGRLTRWPQWIERDDRVVIRVEDRRADARLVHVPHGSEEYARARAARTAKYWGAEGGRAAAESAAHDTVVGVGEVLTGRADREEPGDRLYRVVPR